MSLQVHPYLDPKGTQNSENANVGALTIRIGFFGLLIVGLV